MSQPSTSRSRSLALVMSGGGARAAYQVGVLRGIMRRRPDFKPRVITGVSAGAINAATLAARSGSFAEAVGLLTRLWSNLHTGDVISTRTSSFASTAGRWLRRLGTGGAVGHEARGLLDTQPLGDLLNRNLAEAGAVIDRNIHAGVLDSFGISATNYGTGRSVTWVQGRNITSWESRQQHSVRTRIGVEHILASSALPLFFPARRVGGAWYGDGGIRQVAPLSPALKLGADRILAVNTRHAKDLAAVDVPAISDYPPPAQILGVLVGAVFLDSMDRDVANMRRITELVRHLPESQRRGLRPVEVMVIRPSEDLARVASEYEVDLPGVFRFLMRGLGTRETRSPDWLSMLLFEAPYLQRIMEIGESDAAARMSEIEEFLE